METGATVLALGCGVGLDSLIAAQQIGESRCVVGVDTALSNGIFNRNPARTAIFTELARVIQLSGDAAGFRTASLLRTVRNARTKNPPVVVAEGCAIR